MILRVNSAFGTPCRNHLSEPLRNWTVSLYNRTIFSRKLPKNTYSFHIPFIYFYKTKVQRHMMPMKAQRGKYSHKMLKREKQTKKEQHKMDMDSKPWGLQTEFLQWNVGLTEKIWDSFSLCGHLSLIYVPEHTGTKLFVVNSRICFVQHVSGQRPLSWGRDEAGTPQYRIKPNN